MNQSPDNQSVLADPKDVLGALVRYARKRAGLTQSELAMMVGVSARHIQYIEGSRQKPGYKVLFRLIRSLSIPAESIFYPEIDDS